MKKKKVGILGFGKYGTALASILDENKKSLISIWSRNLKDVEFFKKKSRNRRYLTEVTFSNRVKLYHSLRRVVMTSDYLFWVLPIALTRDIFLKIETDIKQGVLIINGSKGLVRETGETFSETLKSILDGKKEFQVASLSGPSFVSEMIQKKTAKIDVGISNKNLYLKIKAILNNFFFKLNFNSDILGTEVAGALKNVIALISGFLDGAKIGLNLRALIICQAFNEMLLFGKVKGARLKSFLGLAGLGDIFLTATSVESRHYLFGKKMGERDSSIIYFKNENTIEGYNTLFSIYKIGKEKNLKLPIFYLFYKIFHHSLIRYDKKELQNIF